MATKTISINRAQVLTLWAAVVAERLGFDWKESLSLGKALAGSFRGSMEKARQTGQEPDEPSARAEAQAVRKYDRRVDGKSIFLDFRKWRHLKSACAEFGTRVVGSG